MRENKAVTLLRELIKKPEPKEVSTFRYRDLLFFTRFVKPLWLLALLSLTLTVLTALLSSLLPLGGKVLIDFVIMKAGFPGVENLLTRLHLNSLIAPIKSIFISADRVVALFLLIGIVIGLIKLLQNILLAKLQQEVTFNIQTALFDHILRFPLPLLQAKQIGYLMSRISDDVEELQYIFTSAFPQILALIFYLFFIAGIVIQLHSGLALFLFGLLPAFLLLHYFFAARVMAISYEARENQAQVSQGLQEALSGAQVIKVQVAERQALEKVTEKIRKLFRVRLQSALLGAFSSNIVQGLKWLIVLIMLWLGVRESEQGGMTVGDLAAFTAYVIFLAGLVGNLSYTLVWMQSGFASLRRVREMFSELPEFSAAAALSPPASPAIIPPQAALTFERVSFGYDRERPVFQDLSFTVRWGEITALTGASGAGKTTLLNLLLKFHAPQSGRILWGDQDLQEIDTVWLRRQIGVVAQDVFLFNDSIENNIKYGNPQAGRGEIQHAARIAALDRDIDGLPQGYETIVGERGLKLSAGQRQRVSLARAVLKDPPLLIFDEPTAALDEKTEAVLKASLRELNKNRLILMVTHRSSLLDLADRVLVIEEGKIRDAKKVS